MKELRTREEVRDFVTWIEAKKWVVYGERVAVVRDPADEYVGSLVLPDGSQAPKLTGTVIKVGLGIGAEDGHDLAGLAVGDKVTFNRYQTLTTQWPHQDGDDVQVDIFSAADIYVGRRPDEPLYQAGDIE